ncbi:MAG: hypothetical protein WCQ57_05170 [Verrucomicrobiota bacterium]
MKTYIALLAFLLIFLSHSNTSYGWPWSKADIMDQKIDGSSEKALQVWFEHFNKEASETQQAEFVMAVNFIGVLVFSENLGWGSMPESTRVELCNGHKVKVGNLWETLNGLSPSEILKWGAFIQSKAVNN